MVAGLEPIMNLAKAAGADLALTSDIVTDALTAFGLSAEDTAHFTDIIASASSNANTNVELLGESFKYCAPVAGALGFSAEDTAIALGLMANSGIKASNSGTALRGALTNLVKPTDTMAAFMDRYNISITNSDGSMKSLKEIMDLLRQNMGKLSEEEKKQAMAMLESSASAELAGNAMKDLSDEERDQIVASKLGEEAIKGMSDAQIAGALATEFSKEELKGLTDEQKRYQLACRLGQDQLSGLSEAQQAEAASAIFGKEAMSGLLAIVNASEGDYDKLTNAIYNCDGMTKKMADTMSNSTQGQIDNFKSKLEALGIQMADNLLPHVNDLLDKGMELIDWFSNLDSGTQQAIMDFGLMTFATGGLLSVTGKVTTNIGGLVTWVGKLTSSAGTSATKVEKLGSALGSLSSVALPLEIAIAGVSSAVYLYNKEQDALNNTIITAKEDMGFLESALLSLNGAQVESREELEKSGLVYKEFGENIGDNFKGKVEDATKSIHDFGMKLNEISIDNVLSEEETTDFNTRVENCVDGALKTIDSKKEESQNKMKNLFTLGDGAIDESEQQIIEFLNKEFEVEAEEVKKNQEEINKIYSTARSENRALKPEEVEQIKQYYGNIKQIELEAQAENNSELEYAKIDFQNRVKILDAKGASELLVQKKAEVNELCIQKENEYDQLIAVAQRRTDELTGTEKEQAEQKVAQLKQKKEETIQTYQSEWDEYKDIVEKEAPEIVGKYSEYTGEILTNADLQAQKGIEFARQHFEGLGVVTQEGWYKVKNNTTGALEDVYVTVDKSTGEITGCWNQTTNQVGGLTAELKEKVKQLGEEHEIDRLKIQQAMGQIAQAHVDASNNIVTKDGEVIGSLNNVTVSTNGVKEGIVNINGTPMQIQTNANGIITDMTNVEDSVNKLPKTKEITIISKFKTVISDTVKSVANSVGIDQNATGTNNYNGSGLSTVDEKGWELSSNNNVNMIGTYSGNSLASIPRGTAIRTHMQSVSDMKSEVSNQVDKKLGGLYIEGVRYSKEQLKELKRIAKDTGQVIVNGKNYSLESIRTMEKQQKEEEKSNQETKSYLKGIMVNDKFYSNESIRSMKELGNEVGGLTLDNKFYSNESLKAMEVITDKTGNIVNNTSLNEEIADNQSSLNSLTIEGLSYTQQALEAMKIIQDGVSGIMVNGKFYSEQAMEAMKSQPDVKLDGEYYNKDTKKSTELIKTSKSSKTEEIDYNKLSHNVGIEIGNTIKSMLQGLGIDINIVNKLNSKEISSEVTDEVIDKFGKKEKNSKSDKGR